MGSTSAGATRARPASAERSARLKLIAGLMVPAWGRAVLAILGSTALVNLVGLGGQSGYAIIPGLYMALSPPVGSIAVRARTVAVATLMIAGLAVLGAEVSRSTVAIVAGLAIVGFAGGLLPRVGPR